LKNNFKKKLKKLKLNKIWKKN